MSIKEYATFPRIEESRDHGNKRALAGPGGSDNCDGFSRRSFQRNLIQHPTARLIAECYVVEDEVAGRTFRCNPIRMINNFRLRFKNFTDPINLSPDRLKSRIHARKRF